MKKKKNQPSTTKTEDRAKVFEIASKISIFRDRPISLQRIDELAVELFDWAVNDPDALILSEFFDIKGISPTYIARWKKRSPILKESCEIAKAVIANRREKGAIKRKFDSNFIYRTMPLYRKSFKELEKWRSSLRTKENDAKNKAESAYIIEMIAHRSKDDGSAKRD